MRANVFFEWTSNNPDIETHTILILNVFGRTFDQIAEQATSEAREELLQKESTWNGVDPVISTIEVTSHGVE